MRGVPHICCLDLDFWVLSFPPPLPSPLSSSSLSSSFSRRFCVPRRGGPCFLLAYLAPAHCKVSDHQTTFEGPPGLWSALVRTLLLAQVMTAV